MGSICPDGADGERHTRSRGALRNAVVAVAAYLTITSAAEVAAFATLPALCRGYATASNHTGHRGPGGSFALAILKRSSISAIAPLTR